MLVQEFMSLVSSALAWPSWFVASAIPSAGISAASVCVSQHHFGKQRLTEPHKTALVSMQLCMAA